ncbi:histidine phosphatase family protein [Polymorphospora rubra]|uniref:Phosphoglycerate mutase n=1 Tax=Polymorphospora rubra TaxID=338584 RepID=A0A810MW54_9ACTN|nr:histidine phosphatase family protein [Polymorphospora rubra]BCJ65262.1 phosphoglycerate mutase [Polymorphospora rubra]
MAGRFLHLVRHGEALADGTLTERGREQAGFLGRRLATLPISTVHHGPLPRAEQTARLICEHLPGVPVHPSELVGDYIPPVADPQALPDVYTRFLDDVSDEEYRLGADLAAAALARYAVPPETDVDTHELVVTHNFLIGWLVRHALDAPPERWLGLNQGNCALTTILYRSDRPPALVLFNDMGHLPAALRWTGFPAEHHI